MNKTLLILAVVVIISAVIVSLFISGGADIITLGISPFQGKTECDDSRDNDGDGYVDLTDPGCISKDDESELDLTKECDDQIDNDNDGYVDMKDNSCVSPIDVDESI